jgi:hypothetical protein
VRFTRRVETKHVPEVLKIEIGKVKREFNCRVELRLGVCKSRVSEPVSDLADGSYRLAARAFTSGTLHDRAASS